MPKHVHIPACTTHIHAETHKHMHAQHTLMFRWWCSLHRAVPAVVCQWAQQRVPKQTGPPPSASAAHQSYRPTSTRGASTWPLLRSLGTGEDRRKSSTEDRMREIRSERGQIRMGIENLVTTNTVHTYCLNTSSPVSKKRSLLYWLCHSKATGQGKKWVQIPHYSQSYASVLSSSLQQVG